MKYFRSWLVCAQGATAIEYGLIAAGISLAIVGAVLLMGDSLEDYFSVIANVMSDASGDMGYTPR